VTGPDPDAIWAGRRIGILGGTFDPPHRGHIRMASAAHEALGLDGVLLSPAPDPPHKDAAETGVYADRLAMTQRAVEGVDGLAVTRVEESNAPSYSVDLLEACRARSGADFYFILGADSLVDLPNWRAPDEIVRLCTLVVFSRNDAPIVLDIGGDASIVVFESPVVDVSSSGIRAAASRGEELIAWVPEAVAEYIARHGLYRAA
jgi:nicotinate-nucleotide adenylyltransferase